jgi:RNA polymerase sigma-70 factor (ECF subfamily)
MMAIPTQLALTQELDTTIQNPASRQFADADRQNIARQDEEATLVLAAKCGDRDAFEVLIRRYQRRTLAVVRRFTRIKEDAEDIAQQSFQKAFVHLGKFEGKSSFSTWLTRIAINEALMFLRRVRGAREISIDDLSGNEETAPHMEMPDARPSPERALLESEQNKALWAAINKLTPRTRKAIELRDLDELSTREAARVMGLSVDAVKGRVFHGRRKLHHVLKRDSGSIFGKQILRRRPGDLSRQQLLCSSGD